MQAASVVELGLTNTAVLIIKEMLTNVVSNTDNHKRWLFALLEEAKWSHI